jgi:SAM-dependent methyltransferase
MKIINPEKRLKQFWGAVDKKHVNHILTFVDGKKVLDMGCGYGTTTNYLKEKGIDAIGIDYDETAIKEAQTRFPRGNYLFANAENLPFEDKTFDVIILRDALHHFVGEADFEKVRSEILRISALGATMIFFDPNVNFLLKTMRKISRHDDEECDFETANRIMSDMNFTVIHKSFNTLFSLPLSGGYVGLNFVPDVPFLYKIILGAEEAVERVVNALGLGRTVAWRYIIVGKRTEI